MPSLTQLPLEILFSVFCFLDIPDILRMRRVRGIVRELWNHV